MPFNKRFLRLKALLVILFTTFFSIPWSYVDREILKPIFHPTGSFHQKNFNLRALR